jgi:flagellar hook-associated protein 3 FlgL
MKATLNANRQFAKNTADAISWLDTTETAVMQIKDVLERARELSVQGANGVLKAQDGTMISAEVEQLTGQLISLANTTYTGRFIFAGFKTDSPPVRQAADRSTDYTGDNGVLYYEVGEGDMLSVNITARDIFLCEGNDLLADMNDLKLALDSGDTDAVRGMIDRMDMHLQNVLSKVSEIGAKAKRLELISNRLADDEINYTRLLSNTEDADLAEVIIGLTCEENVYRAALAGGARIIQPTLVDFLR